MIRASGDFSDGFGLMSNQTWRFNFCKTSCVSIQRHLGNQIKVIVSRVSQEMVAVLDGGGKLRTIRNRNG